jgi:hypothetical protein
MEKAKVKGKLIGKPQIPQFTITTAREMKAASIGYKAICEKLRISKSGNHQITGLKRT